MSFSVFTGSWEGIQLNKSEQKEEIRKDDDDKSYKRVHNPHLRMNMASINRLLLAISVDTLPAHQEEKGQKWQQVVPLELCA